MTIHIVSYTAEHEPAVRAFNARIAAAGVDPSLYSTSFPEQHIPMWPPSNDCDLYQECFVALDENSIVRGGYVLKHQSFLLDGKTIRLADYQIPISEGIIDGRFATVGVQLYAHALRRQALLFGVGGGGRHVPATKFLLAARWQTSPIPFFFRIVRAQQFLKNATVLSRSPIWSTALQCLAISGLGWCGIRILQRFRGNCRRAKDVAFERVGQFDDWADEVWDECRGFYSLIAVRDRSILNVLYPPSNPRFIRLKITRRSKIIGWAVLLSTRMSGHKQFGNMHVGTLVDCLAAPGDTSAVVACARDVLESNGVDVIVSNQASEAWRRALRNCGFLSGPSNLPFLAAPKLAALLQPLEETAKRFHLNRGDGDGPIHL